MLIAFYSDIRGNAGTTSNLCCLAAYYAIRKKQKILLWENHRNWNRIEDNFTPRTRLSLLCESITPYHMNASKELFCRLQSKEKLELVWQVEELAEELYTDTLYYLPNRQIENALLEKELMKILPQFITLCRESEELVFVDLQDMNKASTQYILEKADLVMLNLMQHMNPFGKKELRKHISISNVRYLIGNYQPNSKINIKNIARKYKIPSMDIATIPYNILCKEAMSEGRVIDFISANIECKQGDYNYPFMYALEQAAKMLNEAMQSIDKGRCEDCCI
ncbi:hypothetical protein [Anaerosporobacter sp.]|uniref:hypothetical protein n=1 Tax=Anaerosporobacter sp. TaxID=1872529 RepID=UPI00286F2A93|nr:hypothetical protein [Anaerosporobacter sp.]